MLGDKVKAVTDTLGIKPCQGCKKRQQTLNQFSRRGVIQGLASGVVAFTLGARSLKAQSAVARDALAIQVMRFLNTSLSRHHNTTGRYAELKELMLSPVVAEMRSSDAAEGHNQGRSLIEQLDTVGPEIIPGWELIYKPSVDGKKYSATLKTVGNSSFTFITNEEAIIETGQPLNVRNWAGRLLSAMGAFRCIGPIGLPGCCCVFPCCDQAHCETNFYCRNCACCFNCGCECCVWCADNSL